MLSDDELTLIERHLEGDLSPAEHEALEALLSRSKAAENYLRDAQAIQRITNSTAPAPAPEAMEQRILAAAHAGRRTGGGWRSAAYAMAASVVLGVAMVSTFILSESPDDSSNMAGTLVSKAARLQQQGIVIDSGEAGQLLVEINRSGSWELTLDGGVNAFVDLDGESRNSLSLKGVGPASHTISVSGNDTSGARVKLTLAAAGRIVLEESVQIQENSGF